MMNGMMTWMTKNIMSLSDNDDWEYNDNLLSNDSNGDYNGSSNDQSVLEESLSDSSSSSGRNIEVHHPNEENETFKDNTSYDAYDSQLNSDENSQEGTIDDESTTILLEVITGVDDEDSIVPGEPTGVGVDKKSSLDCDSNHNPSDDFNRKCTKDTFKGSLFGCQENVSNTTLTIV